MGFGGSSTFGAMLAVARKDLLMMTRYPLMLASRVLEPFGWLLPVYFLGRTFSTDHHAVGFAAWSGTGDYMAFLVVGWMLSGYVGAVLWGMGFSLKNEMDSGVLEANWLTPPSPHRLAGRPDVGQRRDNDDRLGGVWNPCDLLSLEFRFEGKSCRRSASSCP